MLTRSSSCSSTRAASMGRVSHAPRLGPLRRIGLPRASSNPRAVAIVVIRLSHFKVPGLFISMADHENDREQEKYCEHADRDRDCYDSAL